MGAFLPHRHHPRRPSAVGFEPRPGGGAVSEPVVLGDAEAARASHAAPPGARLVTYSSTVTAADLAASAAADAWPQPRILPRSAWGAAIAHAGMGVTIAGIAGMGVATDTLVALRPGESATRAEIAAVLARFGRNVAHLL